jgi:DNA-binding phage protein
MATGARLPAGPRPYLDPRKMRRGMEAAGLHPATLAYKAGVGRISIMRALAGEEVGPKTLTAIAGALGLPLTMQ